MYILFTDESDLQAGRRARFFIYGGLIIDADRLLRLHQLVTGMREEAGFKPTDPLKFAPRTRPDHVTQEAHTAAKQAVVEACAKVGASFLAYAILHDVASNRPKDQLVGFGLNTILAGFNHFLDVKNEKGVVITDKLPMGGDGYPLLREKFQVGLTFPFRGPRPLTNILLYASSCEGASHANSATDIVLGAFRYCVNDRGKASKKLAGAVVPLMWCDERGDTRHIREYGLFLRPKNIHDYPLHKPVYDDLIAYLQSLVA